MPTAADAGVTQVRELLGRRDFRLLFAARTASVLGNAVVPVAVAFAVLDLTGSATDLGIVLAARFVPQLVLLLVGGVLADRLPRYRVMIAGELLSVTAYALVGAMFVSGWAPLPALALSAAVGGVGVALIYPSLVGLVPEVVPGSRLQAANGLLRLGTNTARIAGYAMAGAVVVAVGAGWASGVGAAMFLLAAGLLDALRLPTAGRVVAAGHSTFADLRDGWREFASRQWLWVIVLQFSFMVAAIQAAHGVLGPVVAKQEMGGAPAWSAVLAGEAVGLMVGVFIAIRIRPRRPMLVATLLMLPTIAPFVLLGVAAPLWIVVAGAAVMGICFDIFGVLWETTLQREIPAEALSRVGSYDALGSLMFGPVGVLIAGPVAAAVGARPALLGCALVMTVATLAALTSPDVRRMRARPGTEPVAPVPPHPDQSAIMPELAYPPVT